MRAERLRATSACLAVVSGYGVSVGSARPALARADRPASATSRSGDSYTIGTSVEPPERFPDQLVAGLRPAGAGPSTSWPTSGSTATRRPT